MNKVVPPFSILLLLVSIVIAYFVFIYDEDEPYEIAIQSAVKTVEDRLQRSRELSFTSVKLTKKENTYYVLINYNGYLPRFDENYQILEDDYEYFENRLLFTIDDDFSQFSRNIYVEDSIKNESIQTMWDILTKCEENICDTFDINEINTIIK